MTKGRPLTLVLAGGGTGGHLYPALAIADEIRRRHPDARITFVGTRGRIESRVVPERGYPLVTIWISGFRRRLSLSTVLFPLRLLVAFLQSVTLLLKTRPDVVIGTGGFVCGPVVAAAQVLGAPTLLQEQNSVPGVTTRLLASRADEVHLAFESAESHLRRRDNIRRTGNPTRDLLGTVTRSDGARAFGFDPHRPTLLVFGGSRGAATINRALAAIAGDLARERVQVLWQTGEEEFRRLRDGVGEQGGMIRIVPYIDRMECAYAACDLAVCRAGATSLAELTRTGVPSILIPYPHAAADHQTANARAMVAAGAALLLPDAEAGAGLAGAVRSLLGDRSRLRAMADAARRLAKPGAAAALADAVEHLACA